MKERWKWKKYSGGAGIRTRTFSGETFLLPEHLWMALTQTSGKVSLVQLAQIARSQKKEFTAADAQWGLSYSEIVFQLQLQQLC